MPATRDRTDAELLRLARAGDPRAYEAIVARYREPLRRSCARLTPERAEDAVQQALLSAWLALERGADVRELRPWLYSIARNAAIDQTRATRSELVELGSEVPGGEDPARAEARRREVIEVLEAVAALPERQRQALVETALHGRATEAVADDLGLSGGALRQLVHRARTTVRAAVPSVAFPMPAWLAGMLSEEGARGGALLLGSGGGAAILAKTTATVATVGAVVAGGAAVDRSAERSATGTTIAAATPVPRATPARPTRPAGPSSESEPVADTGEAFANAQPASADASQGGAPSRASETQRAGETDRSDERSADARHLDVHRGEDRPDADPVPTERASDARSFEHGERRGRGHGGRRDPASAHGARVTNDDTSSANADSVATAGDDAAVGEPCPDDAAPSGADEAVVDGSSGAALAASVTSDERPADAVPRDNSGSGPSEQ